MFETDTQVDLQQPVEGLLSADLTQTLRDATAALDRLAPAAFEAIGARALNLDVLVMNAAAALPELLRWSQPRGA